MASYRQIGEGSYLLNGSVGGRPLYLPLLVDEDGAMLIDTGCAPDVGRLILPALEALEIGPDRLRWIINTHCDVDHQGGNHAMKQFAPRALLCCGDADREQIESPDAIVRQRYDAYRARHAHVYPEPVLDGIRADLGAEQQVDLTFRGGERIRFGNGRELQILALPGHSRGHLGVLDRRDGTLFGGDAVHGAVYLDLEGNAALCPTYLHVAPYRQTIAFIRQFGVDRYVGCHWPIMSGEEIARFCDESRMFVDRAEQLILAALRQSRHGMTLTELCQQLGPALGDWPEPVHHELCYAFNGHLEDLELRGAIEQIPDSTPARFRRVEER